MLDSWRNRPGSRTLLPVGWERALQADELGAVAFGVSLGEQQPLQRVEDTEYGMRRTVRPQVKVRVAIPPELAVLDEIRALQDARRRDLGMAAVGPRGWILSNDGLGGAPRNPNAVAHALTRAYKRAKIRPISAHDLRHFAATQMLRAGIPADAVARRLHHKDASITFAVYSHPTDADERRAGEAVAALLS